MQLPEEKPLWKTVVFMVFNFLSSVSIIVVNKIVFQDYKFIYGTFITVIHFIVTFLGLHVLAHYGHFEIKRVSIRDVMPLVVTFCGFVVFNNLSLLYNSIGCYQLMKVMTTPVIAVVQAVSYDARLDHRLTLSLVPICFGVIMATVNDMQLNFLGVVFGVLGIISTSYYQIFVKVKQKQLGLNSYQLLYYQAPLSAGIVLLFVPFFDNVFDIGKGLLYYQYTSGAIFYILLTALLAFCVNLSIYLVIGYTSPISYNVLGHFKLCVVLFSGWIFFAEDMNSKKLFGAVLTVTGVILYTHLKQKIDNEWDKKPNASSQGQYQPVSQSDASLGSLNLNGNGIGNVTIPVETVDQQDEQNDLNAQEMKPMLLLKQ
eukprot:TRINITY_DN1530_c0_g1_i1.p1 TRINITY_DN1530_c0_g1~~TRINITY_DN1530_c0_g1_i1.p1  ORF type:complete len:371 (-),score=93.29 TRINITY_DN1530_c0_g1_i1:50-1162(-)